jgi:DNA polymerase III epsilon subunit family exonuclease
MLSSALKNITFAFFDVETTGLNSCYGDKVCEVAILKSRNGRKISSFHSLVDPGCRGSPGAYAVNGITQKMLKGKPKFSQIAADILKLLKGAVMVCHNAPFDMGFLEVELDKVGISLPGCPVVDTLTLARRRFKFYSNSLGNVAESLGIKTVQEHRAMSDCILTQKVFQRFIENFEWRGITTLDELLSVQEGPSRKRWDEEFTLPPHLDEAVKNKKPLHLRYVSAEGKVSKRVVDPIQIERSGNCVYLVGYCRLRKAERMFRLDRIIELQPAKKGEG